MIAGPSSSPVISKPIEPAGRRSARKPRRRRDEAGDRRPSCRPRRARRLASSTPRQRTDRRVQAAGLPGGTTSVWPAKAKVRPPCQGGRRDCRPAPCRAPRTAADGRRSPGARAPLRSDRARRLPPASRSGSGSAPASRRPDRSGRIIAQQLVDRGLGARSGVDPLDDHRAVEPGRGGRPAAACPAARPGRPPSKAGTRPWKISPVARSTILVEAPRTRPSPAPRPADDHALGHLGPGADEAVVLDDHRVGLQRLQHAADPGAAGDVAVPADLRAGADRGPGVDHRAFVDVGADVDEGGHQHDVRADVGGAADDAPGTARKPACWNRAAAQPANFEGTLSHHGRRPARR